jgi:hypothetical protein
MQGTLKSSVFYFTDDIGHETQVKVSLKQKPSKMKQSFTYTISSVLMKTVNNFEHNTILAIMYGILGKLQGNGVGVVYSYATTDYTVTITN